MDAPGSARWRSSRKALVIAVVIGAAVAVVAGLLLTRNAYEPGGPLANPRVTSVTTHSTPGEEITWGTVLPENPTASDIIIESIEPSSPVSGLTILGIGVSNPLAGAVGTAEGYPPAGIQPLPVAGAVITPRDRPGRFLQVVVGVRLDDASQGRIAGLRIRYSAGGHRYETVLSDALVVVPPEP